MGRGLDSCDESGGGKFSTGLDSLELEFRRIGIPVGNSPSMKNVATW